jgi:hypothetical protein
VSVRVGRGRGRLHGSLVSALMLAIQKAPSVIRCTAIALLTSIGCSTVVPVQRPVSKESADEINARLRGQDATVTYAPPGAQPVKEVATEVAINGENVDWTQWESEEVRDRRSPAGHRVEAPVEAVKEISFCDRSCRARGFFEGAAIGTLVGAGVGTGIGLGIRGRYENVPVEPYILLGIGLGLLLGGLSGLAGHPTEFDFTDTAHTR